MFDLNSIVRENVKDLIPYSSARDEFKGAAEVWLDANESPFNDGYNRYPDASQSVLKNKISELKHINANQVFLGNGSDEAIDLIIRAFCEPNQDEIIICPPTYGMYEVSARINAVAVKEIPLKKDFSLNEDEIEEYINDNKKSKLIFVCSPNNPTGNIMSQESIIRISRQFSGLIVVDEAYVDFAEKSNISLLKEIPNLIIIQTFSKAWGMAGLRLGMAFASKDIIGIINKIKPPYNINSITQKIVLERINEKEIIENRIDEIKKEKKSIIQKIRTFPFVRNIFPSSTNFLLIQVSRPKEIYQYLSSKGIIVRDRTKYVNNALRITIGLPKENQQLIEALQSFETTLFTLENQFA